MTPDKLPSSTESIKLVESIGDTVKLSQVEDTVKKTVLTKIEQNDPSEIPEISKVPDAPLFWKGKIWHYRFTAKVYMPGRWIDNSWVAKLIVCDQLGVILQYDRWWGIEPTDEWQKNLVKILVEHLDKAYKDDLPPEFFGLK